MPADAAALEALILRGEVEQFLFREAAALDAGDFSAWLELFADDAVYWVTAGHGAAPASDVAIVRDDLARLKERVWRLESGLAYAQEPSSSTMHLIGNVRLVERREDLVVAEAAFVVGEFRRGRRTVHTGRSTYQLRTGGRDLAIVLKRVDLIDNDGHLGNLSYPL